MKRVRWPLGLLIITLVVIAAASMLWNGRISRPGQPAPTPNDGTAPTHVAVPTPTVPTPQATRASDDALSVGNHSDPDSYAAAVAAALFSIDTRAFDAEDYRRSLMGQADPLMSESGVSDLQVMVDERIPDATRWGRMRANQQWSQWSLTAVWEPETWAEIVTDGLAEPGWALRNVTGTQTTRYVDGGEGRTAVSEPTVTIGMRCPAPGAGVDRCHLTLIGTVVVP